MFSLCLHAKSCQPSNKPSKPALKKSKHIFSLFTQMATLNDICCVQFMTFGASFITTFCCVDGGIVLQNMEAKWSIGCTHDLQVQTLVTQLVNYKSQRRAEGERSRFGDEWIATMQREIEGGDSPSERKKMRRRRELYLDWGLGYLVDHVVPAIWGWILHCHSHYFKL